MKKRTLLAALLLVPMGVALAESIQDVLNRRSEAGRPVVGSQCQQGSAFAGICLPSDPITATGVRSETDSISGQPYQPDAR